MHIERKHICASGVVALGGALAHHMHMTQQRPKKHYLREWREFRGMTLEQVGPLIPMTHQNLGKIERGATNYTQPVLEALAAIYATTTADLLLRDPNSPDSIYSVWEQLDPAAQTQVVEIAKTFRRAS